MRTKGSKTNNNQIVGSIKSKTKYVVENSKIKKSPGIQRELKH